MYRLHYLAAFVPFLVIARASDVGPKYPPTKGEVWPKPQHELKNNTYYVLGGVQPFKITKPYHSCDILDKAIDRLLGNLKIKYEFVEKGNNEKKEVPEDRDSFGGTFATNTEFRIELSAECEQYPHFEMDESYLLTVGEKVVLSSESIWGILRGLETFNHLLYFTDDYNEIRINSTSIVDYPAYMYRGLLIDTGRHYLRPDVIKTLMYAMEMNKLNVLHWHIVDDQSFPYQSEKFPELSERGAFHPSMVYTKHDVQEIVELGRLLGIRVIPELDVPGHTRSWGEAYPYLLTKCFEKKKTMGPLDPIRNTTFKFLKELYKEVTEVFPDEYVHLGGDEVNPTCWLSNPDIMRYMDQNKLSARELHALFMINVISLLPSKTKTIVWQEVFDTGVPLPSKTLVQVWKYHWIKEMDAILKAGQRVVFSSSWYLDYLNQGWTTFYKADPRSMVYNLRKKAKGLEDIVGGEACMWGEMADETNIVGRTWPRASAVAERLWSGIDYKSTSDPVTNEVIRRIEEHACRMNQRGVAAEPPNGPSFCPKLS